MSQRVPKTTRKVWSIFAVLAVTAMCLLACRGGTSDWRVSEGQLLPEFTLRTPDGKSVSTSEYRGKILVITRFATWCPPCKIELGELQKRVWEPMKDRGVMVVAVSSGEDPQTVASYVEREGLTFPVLVDPSGEFARGVGGNSIPRLMLLDRDQYIRKLHVGYYEPEFQKLVKEVEALAR